MAAMLVHHRWDDLGLLELQMVVVDPQVIDYDNLARTHLQKQRQGSIIRYRYVGLELSMAWSLSVRAASGDDP